MEDKAIISALHLWKQLNLPSGIPLCKTGRVAKMPQRRIHTVQMFSDLSYHVLKDFFAVVVL